MAVVVGTVIVAGDAVLAQQRDWPVDAAGRWEFPGGRVEPGETEPEAVVRECREELGARVRVGARIGPDVPLPNGWTLRIYTAVLAGDERPVAREHRAVRWVTAAELADLDWLEPDRVVLPYVAGLLAATADRA